MSTRALYWLKALIFSWQQRWHFLLKASFCIFSIVKQLLCPLLYASAICGWITWVYSIIIDRESMYRKEQGGIVSTSACLEILTISNFQRRMRKWTMEMTFWLKGKSHTDIHSGSPMRPTRTVTFGFCDWEKDAGSLSSCWMWNKLFLWSGRLY